MIVGDQLKSFIERVERLSEEKKTIASDIRDVYTEAKANGFDIKALRQIVKLRKIDADERKEQEAILETYMHALGMLFDTPLGQSATERASGGGSAGSGGGTPPKAKPQTASELAQQGADLGLISQEAADETKRIESAIDKKFGRAGFRRRVAKRLTKAFGEPVPLNDEEKAQGYSAAFIGKDGNRVAMGFGMSVPRASTLVNPQHLPSQKMIDKVVDRAEKRSRDNGGSGSAPPVAQGGTPPATPAPVSSQSMNSHAADTPASAAGAPAPIPTPPCAGASLSNSLAGANSPDADSGTPVRRHFHKSEEEGAGPTGMADASSATNSTSADDSRPAGDEPAPRTPSSGGSNRHPHTGVGSPSHDAEDLDDLPPFLEIGNPACPRKLPPRRAQAPP